MSDLSNDISIHGYCPHGRSSWRSCPYCLGVSRLTAGGAAPHVVLEAEMTVGKDKVHALLMPKGDSMT